MDRLLNAVRRHAADLDGQGAQPRLANIASFDPTSHSVRVILQPEGRLSGWCPLPAVAVGPDVGIVAPPSPGDQVLVVPQEGDAEHPLVVGRIFHSTAMPPVSPATGHPVQPGEVAVFTPGAWLHFTADGTVHGAALRWNLAGDIHCDGDVYDRHGSMDRLRGAYDAHRHPGVKAGPDVSGTTDHIDAE